MTGAVLGLPALRAAFRRAPTVLQAQFNEATEATVLAVRTEAIQRVPVDTGTLRDHIAAAFSRKSGFGRVGIKSGRVAVAGAGGSALTARGARVIEARTYGRFVEFGTVHTTAQPFMLPAAEAQRGHFAKRLRDAGQRAERQLAVSRFT